MHSAYRIQLSDGTSVKIKQLLNRKCKVQFAWLPSRELYTNMLATGQDSNETLHKQTVQL